MGWTWTCFGGRKERVRRINSDGRVRQKNRERLDRSQARTNPRAPSLAAQNRPKSPARDSSAYDEPFQPKQVVRGSQYGSKLFRRKTVRRNNSLGSNSFQNGANKDSGKKSEPKLAGDGQPEVLVDRLQEEVEALRKKLAEEEAETRKLRNEVVYLRSCGVLQSPERLSGRSIGRESPRPGSFKDDRTQRHLESWLGLTLSPSSRSKLEDQLRLMAAEEISKNPGKGLTNGQKALIVASRLWNYQADDASQVKFETRDSYSPDTSSYFGNNLTHNQAVEDLLPEVNVHPKGGESKAVSKDAPLPECEEEESTLNVGSFRDSLDLEISPGSSFVEKINIKTSLSYETQNFSFHPSSEKPGRKDNTVVQTTVSFPKKAKLSAHEDEQIDGEFERFPAEEDEQTEEELEKCRVEEQVKFESPRRPSASRNPDAAVPALDEGRRFIDRRYHQLGAKLSKSLNTTSSPTAAPDRSPPQPIPDSPPVQKSDSSLEESEQASSPETEPFPLSNAAPDSVEVTSDEDSPESPSNPVMKKTFFSARTGRMWQPLSPVKEIDSERSSVRSSVLYTSSALSSRKDLTETDERGFSTDSWSSQSRSPSTSLLPSSEQDGDGEESSTTGSGLKTGLAPDTDHFTVSSRMRARQYYPRGDDTNFQADYSSNGEMDTSVERSTTTNWTTSEDSDDDIHPIQCQSPDLSPQPLRSKYAKKKEDLNVEYPRDIYLKETGLRVEELLLSSVESAFSAEPLHAHKEHLRSVESFTVPLEGHPATSVYTFDEIPQRSKTYPVSDVINSRESVHPVLASIENLPKWVEHQGISVAAAKKEKSDVPLQDVNEEGMRSHAQTQQDGIACVNNLTAELSGLDFHQVEEEKSKPFYFDISDIERKEFFSQNADEKPSHYRELKDKHHRYSVSSDHASDKPQGERTPSKDMLDLFSASQDELDCSSPSSGEMDANEQHFDACSSTKLKMALEAGSESADYLYSPRMQALDSSVDVETHIAEKIVLRNGQLCADHQGASAVLKSRLPMRKLAEIDESRAHNRERVDPADNSVTSRTCILEGSVGETESHEESCSSNQLHSPGVSMDESDAVSSFSRMSDGTVHSHESALKTAPSTTKITHETSSKAPRGNSMPGTEVEPLYPVRGLPSISPDDRPILGTVATWWGIEGSKSRAWWDGQGIPNSTSKYKEDQRVSWHTTPFETRLERALASQTMVPTEPAGRRDLFGGGVESY
ncbi:hypothetical protein R1flu_007750 [Riccia fluitans]|uniref:Uncharacterized protein n=1 Tax=Riccia fluitans TaxID=41844 RepID=A0ABD1YZR7_9MARC